jgi:hypothetical protein
MIFYALMAQNIAMLLIFASKTRFVYFGFLLQSTFLLYLGYAKLLNQDYTEFGSTNLLKD